MELESAKKSGELYRIRQPTTNLHLTDFIGINSGFFCQLTDESQRRATSRCVVNSRFSAQTTAIRKKHCH